MLPLSVIIPTYNRAHLISRALKSAIAECDERDEILVVDDASTDDTAKVLAGFPRVTYIRAEHGGAGRTRNLGIARSKHPLVAFLDSDDEWVPGALAPRRALLEARPDLVFCFTDFAGTFSDGSYRHGLALTWHEDHRPWDQILGPPISIGSIPSLASIPVHIGRMD
ncbi:MAG: glycosyltransferase family 2 protein, partial [Bdellovibrionota bacterium]